MIEIRNININPQGDKLVIDANIVSNTIFDNCYIKKVYIDTQNTYTVSGPSENTVYEKDITTDDADKFLPNSTITIDEKEYVRNLHLVISEEEICANLQSDFFIIYIQSDGDFDKSKISKCDSSTLISGCVFWMRPLYSDFLGFVRELNQSCEVPRNFIYLYLQYQALLVAVRTGNMLEAIEIFKKFIMRHPHHEHHDNSCYHCGEHHHKEEHDEDDEHFHHHHHHHDEKFIGEHHNCNCHYGGNRLQRH